MKIHNTILIALITMALLALVSRAQQTAPAGSPRVIELTLHASAATRPVDRYPLLPKITEQIPGNGAPLYLTAARIGPDSKAADDLTGQLGDRFRDMPLNQLASSDFEAGIQPFGERLEVLDLAARREEAHWDSTLRDQGAAAKLPYLSDLRINARILSLKARWQIARRDWAGAARTLQTGLSMSQQMNDHATLIQGLVEAGIADLLLDRVDDWIGQSGSPNLYWSLADLPGTFVDLRTISQWEQATIYFTFPELKVSEPEQISAEGWRGIFASMNRMTGGYGDKPVNPQQLSLQMASTFPKAKESLVAAGISRARVEAMSVSQVVGSYYFREYLRTSEDEWRGWELPYWEGLGRRGTTLSAWEIHRQRVEENPMMAFIPIVKNARLQFARIDRKICLLRILEALRDHAATHQLHLPATLEELSLPVPLDPVSGRAFPYRSDGATAALEVAPYDPPSLAGGFTYHLSVDHLSLGH